MTCEDTIKEEIYRLISKHQPIGWYKLEVILPIQRKHFKQGYTLMTYLNEMVAEGKIKQSTDEKYILK